MTSISRLFPELEKDEKSPQSTHADSLVKDGSSSSSQGAQSPRRDNSGIDSSCDSGRVSTPASLVENIEHITDYAEKNDKQPNSFRPWEDGSQQLKERVPELGLHKSETPVNSQPVLPSNGLNPFANWALNYPLFSMAALQQNALSGHLQQQLHQHHHQQQLLQQLFLNQQQKNMQAYNAYRLQSELSKSAPKKPSLERPWEQAATKPAATASPPKAVKMETENSAKSTEKPKPKEKKDNGNKPYKCPICDAQFNRPANLKTHLRIHSGEKPYKCDTCSARFVQVAHLRAHVLIHTGEKPYPCQICGTRFRHLQTLKSHIRIHTGEKPFSCDECDLKFRHKSQLRLHLRTKHNINTNTKKSYTFVPGLNSADLSKIIKDSNKANTSTSCSSSCSCSHDHDHSHSHSCSH